MPRSNNKPRKKGRGAPPPVALGSACIVPVGVQVEALVRTLIPSRAAEERRRAVFDYVADLLEKRFEQCERLRTATCCATGSFLSKTYLPESDLDVTVLHAGIDHVVTDDSVSSVSSRGTVEDCSEDSWVMVVNEALCRSALQKRTDGGRGFEIRNVTFVNARTAVVNCLVLNIPVDVTANQMSGVAAQLLLEETDRYVGCGHLFKRSLVLIKAWCRHEGSRYGAGLAILSSRTGHLSTHALNVMVLAIFIDLEKEGPFMDLDPLSVLTRFLQVYARFRWQACWVNVVKTVEDGEPDERCGLEAVVGRLCACLRERLAVVPNSRRAPSTFEVRSCNVVDPFTPTNNLGLCVSAAGLIHITRAFSDGWAHLQSLLRAPPIMGAGASHWFTQSFFNTSIALYADGLPRPDLLDHPCQTSVPASPSVGRGAIDVLNGDVDYMWRVLDRAIQMAGTPRSRDLSRITLPVLPGGRHDFESGLVDGSQLGVVTLSSCCGDDHSGRDVRTPSLDDLEEPLLAHDDLEAPLLDQRRNSATTDSFWDSDDDEEDDDEADDGLRHESVTTHTDSVDLPRSGGEDTLVEEPPHGTDEGSFEFVDKPQDATSVVDADVAVPPATAAGDVVDGVQEHIAAAETFFDDLVLDTVCDVAAEVMSDAPNTVPDRWRTIEVERPRRMRRAVSNEAASESTSPRPRPAFKREKSLFEALRRDSFDEGAGDSEPAHDLDQQPNAHPRRIKNRRPRRRAPRNPVPPPEEHVVSALEPVDVAANGAKEPSSTFFFNPLTKLNCPWLRLIEFLVYSQVFITIYAVVHFAILFFWSEAVMPAVFTFMVWYVVPGIISGVFVYIFVPRAAED